MNKNIHNIIKTDNTKIRKAKEVLGKYLSKDFIKKIAIDNDCDDIRERDLPIYAFTQLMILGSNLGKEISLRELALSSAEWNLTDNCISPQRISQQVQERGYKYFESLYDNLKDFALGLPRRCRRKVLRKFKKTNILDGSSFRLCNKLIKIYQGKRGKSGFKLHTSFNLDYLLPEAIIISNSKVHDNVLAPYDLNTTGVLYIIDRGYNDYEKYKELIESGNDFVTRIKKNIVCKVIRDLNTGQVFKKKTYLENIKSRTREEFDLIVELTNGLQLRLVRYYDNDANEYYTYITSLLDNKTFTKEDIRYIYKYRWQIEIFFRDLKHVLGCIKIIYETEDRIKSQIYSSLCYYLIVRIFILIAGLMLRKHPIDFSFKRCARLVKKALLEINKDNMLMDKAFVFLTIDYIINYGVKPF